MSIEFSITENTIIADILREHPKCIEVFDKHSMPCMTCMGVSTDTLSDGAMMHDVNLDQLMSELQSCCQS